MSEEEGCSVRECGNVFHDSKKPPLTYCLGSSTRTAQVPDLHVLQDTHQDICALLLPAATCVHGKYRSTLQAACTAEASDMQSFWQR